MTNHRMNWSRWTLLGAVFSLALGACQSTTETTRTPSGASSGPASSESANRTPLPGSGPIESEPTRRARIRTDLAANYYQDRKYSVALEELRQAVAADPTFAPAYGMTGLVYMSLGENDKADDSFRRALTLTPADSELNNNYGWFLCQTGREQASIAYFNNAIKDSLYATPARPLHNAGICSLRVGDERAAESFFLRSFQLDAGNAVAMYQLAELYLKRGDLVRARFYSQRLLTSYDPSAEMLWQGYRIERRGANASGADNFASQLRRRFPASSQTQLLIQGRYE
jgi:type IV pilus assembly protein PilF